MVDWTSEDPISDNILEEGWYRVYSDNGDAMPTATPGTKYCGTTNPFWLNGTEGNSSKIYYYIYMQSQSLL